MTFTLLLLAVYILSALIVGGIHWAAYKDAIAKKTEMNNQEKVKALYIMPLCPIVNSVIAFNYCIDLFD